MAEYIDRKALGIGKCNPEIFDDKGYANGWNAAIDIIQSAPTADVRPVRVGKLEKYGAAIRCSVCGFDTQSWDVNFCPNCGARMEES